MGGFALALGGAGQALQKYGEQQRQLDQQSRISYASQLGDLARQYPPDSDEYLKGKAALDSTYGNRPQTVAGSILGKLLPHKQAATPAFGPPPVAPAAAAPQAPGGNILTAQPPAPAQPPPPPAQLPGYTLPGAEGTGTPPLLPPPDQQASVDQTRPALESHRGHFANLMQQQAQTESDPNTRSSMLQHAADAASGKPIGGILKAFATTLTKRIKDHQNFQEGAQKLQAATGQQTPQGAAPQTPGATPVGQTAGSGGNALPNAAQPATSPAASGGQIQISPVAEAVAPGVAVASPTIAPSQGLPDTAAPVIPSVVRMPGTPGSVPPVAQASDAVPPVAPLGGAASPIVDDPYGDVPPNLRQYIGSNSVLRQKQIEPYVLQRAQHKEALRLATETNRIKMADTLAQRQADEVYVKQLQTAHPDWPLPLILSMAVPGIQVGNALQVPHTIVPSMSGKGIPEFDQGGHPVVDGAGNPIDRSGASNYEYKQLPGTITPGYYLLPPKLITTQTANGIQRSSATVPGAVAGAIPPAQNGVAVTGVNPATGQHIYQRRGSLLSLNDFPILGAGVDPGFVTSTSTSVQPGAPPVSTTRTKGGGRAPAATMPGNIPPVVPPASHGGSIPPAGGGGPKPVEFNDPLAEANYKNYKAGGVAPTGRQLQGVQLYAQSHGLPMPSVTNSAGQKSVAIIDPVIQEVNDAIEKLNNLKGNPSLATDYVKYKNGFSTPYDDLFTNLSFESLRSAASALQGMNSRAYPIISRALQHTPNLDRLGGFNPDSISLMKDKLNSIKGILQQARGAAANDEAKSGVIPSVVANPGRGGLAPPPGATAAPIIQHSPSTGAYRYSTDGGSTWQAGQPPQ